jgi:hypothetical protein
MLGTDATYRGVITQVTWELGTCPLCISTREDRSNTVIPLIMFKMFAHVPMNHILISIIYREREPIFCYHSSNLSNWWSFLTPWPYWICQWRIVFWNPCIYIYNTYINEIIPPMVANHLLTKIVTGWSPYRSAYDMVANIFPPTNRFLMWRFPKMGLSNPSLTPVICGSPTT